MVFKNGEVRSHLSTLKEAYPDFNWPKQGEQRNYPKELGAGIGEIRRFGFLQRKYELIFRSSDENSAIEIAEKYVSEGKRVKITYNPIRLETYGVWISV